MCTVLLQNPSELRDHDNDDSVIEAGSVVVQHKVVSERVRVLTRNMHRDLDKCDFLS